jgi:hypothetical protein
MIARLDRVELLRRGLVVNREARAAIEKAPAAVAGIAELHGPFLYTDGSGLDRDRRLVKTGESVPVPLGKYTDFGSGLVPQQLANVPSLPPGTSAKDLDPDAQSAYRLGRAYAALYHVRRLLVAYGLYGRVASCGARLLDRRAGVRVYRRPDRVHGRVGGVCMCGSSLACPVCAPRISGRRVGEIEQAAIRARHEGSRAFLLTFTLPHQEGSNLLEEIRVWSRAWELSTKGRGSFAWREDMRGFINGTEINRSVGNGWHFHRHLLVFSKGGVPPDFEAWRDAWRRASCALGRYTDGWEERAFHWKEVFDSFDYVAKVGFELGMPLTKASKSVVWLALADLEDPGRWGADYCEAVWALQIAKVGAVRWSRGLRAGLGLKEAVSDEQAAIETATETDELLGALSVHQWEKIVFMNLEAPLVQVAQCGRGALNDFLVEYNVGPLDSDFSTAD